MMNNETIFHDDERVEIKGEILSGVQFVQVKK